MSAAPAKFSDDDLLKAMGMEKLPAERRKQAVEETLTLLNYRIVNRIADQLSEKQLDEINELTEKSPSDNQLRQWFEANVPNYITLVEEEATKMRDADKAMVEKTLADFKAQQSSD